MTASQRGHQQRRPVAAPAPGRQPSVSARRQAIISSAAAAAS